MRPYLKNEFGALTVNVSPFKVQQVNNTYNLSYANNEFNFTAFDGQLLQSYNSGYSVISRKLNNRHYIKIALVPGRVGQYAIRLNIADNSYSLDNFNVFDNNTCTNYKVGVNVLSAAQNLNLWNNWNTNNLILLNTNLSIAKTQTNYILMNVIP